MDNAKVLQRLDAILDRSIRATPSFGSIESCRAGDLLRFDIAAMDKLLRALVLLHQIAASIDASAPPSLIANLRAFAKQCSRELAEFAQVDA